MSKRNGKGAPAPTYQCDAHVLDVLPSVRVVSAPKWLQNNFSVFSNKIIYILVKCIHRVFKYTKFEWPSCCSQCSSTLKIWVLLNNVIPCKCWITVNHEGFLKELKKFNILENMGFRWLTAALFSPKIMKSKPKAEQRMLKFFTHLNKPRPLKYLRSLLVS